MNVTGVLVLLFVVGLTLFASERLGNRGGVYTLVARKLLHVVGIGAVAVSPLLFADLRILTWILIIVSVLLGVVVWKNWLAVDAQPRKSWGIALFPLAACLLLQMSGSSLLYITVYPMLVLTFADAFAALAGGFLGKKYFTISGDPKSVVGSLAFIITSMAVLLWLPALLQQYNPLFQLTGLNSATILQKWVLVFTLALVVALFEAATSGGWDNVTVPFAAAWLLWVLPEWAGDLFYLPLLVLLVLACLGALAFYRGWLNAGGSVVAVLLGFTIWMGAGTYALLLIGVFFVSSSIISRLTSTNKTEAGDSKHGKPRDYRQVLSNGAVAGICMVGYSITLYGGWLILFATSVAVSTADTWSSEVGTALKGKVVDIIGFKPLPKGISGGISWQGTLAGLIGAVLIASVSYLIGIEKPIFIAVGGFVGMLIDSIMGSLIQAKYKNSQGQLSDMAEPETKNNLAKGLSWVGNDLVNLLSNLILTIFMAVFLFFTL